MQAAYINSVFSFTPEVCGKKLLPLSLGHSLLLDIIESPFVSGGPVRFDDIVTLIWLCSLPFEQAADSIGDMEQSRKEIEEWGKSVGAALDIVAAETVVRDYLAHYCARPAMWDSQIDSTFDGAGKARASRKAKVQWQFSLAHRLLGKFTESEIWNMPLCKAITWHACYLDDSPESPLMEDEAIALRDMAENESTES